MTSRRSFRRLSPARWLVTGALFIAHGRHPCPAQLPPFPAASESVNLSWDASPSPDVVGFNVYCGTAAGNYTNTISAGNATNTIIYGLTAGVTYYFAATATDAIGQESDYSDEVSYTPLNTTPVPIPQAKVEIKVEIEMAESDDLVTWRTNKLTVFQGTNETAPAHYWRAGAMQISSRSVNP